MDEFWRQMSGVLCDKSENEREAVKKSRENSVDVQRRNLGCN